ncbi:MAG: type II toxin-antitoxin system VapC family toxin [Magnetococcales bacterium]|nr:type II toxin-antitoxin system VapC family toxin [Magnetococcales bacterium]
MSGSDWLLLDTHIWIWWAKRDRQLAPSIAKRLDETRAGLAISSVSVYEALLQIRRGRVAIDLPVQEWLHAATVEAGIEVIAVNAEIAAKAALLPLHHGDPLDRIIIATALHHDVGVVSVDGQFPHYEALAGRLISN